jgi:hypothetical protein
VWHVWYRGAPPPPDGAEFLDDEESNPNDQPEVTDRGFRVFPYIDLGDDRRVRVYESSAATEPKIWIRIVDDDGMATAHMRISDARELARQIVWLCNHHYHGTGSEKDLPMTEQIECPVCHGERGGYICGGDCDWEWEPCPRCREAGYIIVEITSDAGAQRGDTMTIPDDDNWASVSPDDDRWTVAPFVAMQQRAERAEAEAKSLRAEVKSLRTEDSQ